MNQRWPQLPEAAADFRFLLARGYPRKNALDLMEKGMIPETGRNDPCPCGSGKKYKNCCLKMQ